MELFPTDNGGLAVICESRRQTKQITIVTHFVLHHFKVEKVGPS
jgi:hypothetical protein